MQILECNTVAISDLYKDGKIKEVFCEQPVIITQGAGVIQINRIENNLAKEIQTSNLPCLIVVELIGEKDKACFKDQIETVKISLQFPLKNLFDSNFSKPGQIEELSLNLFRQKLLKTEQFGQKQEKIHLANNLVNKQQQQNKQAQNNQNSHSTCSMRLFPFHKSVNRFAMFLHQQLVPLSQFDILSYQKVQRFCNYEYVFGLQGYEEEICCRIETQLYLNWGQQSVEFVLISENGTSYSHTLRHCEIIIVPPMFKCKWKNITTQKNSLSKLITWIILPKCTFTTLLTNLQPQQKKPHMLYPIHQILIDYCFHEFALLELQSEQLMYTLANLLNRQFMDQLYLLQHVLKLTEDEVLNGANDKKVDECQICGKFIVNYFGFHKNVVSCLQCVKKDIKTQKVYQKLPKITFEQGCQMLTRIKSYKEQKQAANQNMYKLMKNAVFFQYEDICDGEFIGSYHSAHCRINETNHKKIINPKEKIVQNTIDRVRKNLNISNIVDIIKKYSGKVFGNVEEEKFYRKILKRASLLMTKNEQALLLAEMLPNYQQNNLKLFAIKLCVKDTF